MTITLSENYYATLDDTLLGYCGEHRARKIIFQGLAVEGADHYKLRFCYKDHTSYEVDITEGEYIIDGSVLRAPQRIKAQIFAVKLSENEGYELVRKSQIFELEIKPSLCGEPAPIPTYEAAQEYLDEILDAIDENNNYDRLLNKPQINGHTLEGDKTFEELGIEPITSAELAAMWDN